MKILCICCLWESFREVIYGGECNPNGMPASHRVLKRLLECGHDVDYIFYSYFPEDRGKKLYINSDWLKIDNIKDIIYFNKTTGFTKLYSYFKGAFALRKSVRKALNKVKYDFIFGQNPTADLIAGIANKHNIPYGCRRFGDQFYNLINTKGYLYACFTQPFEYYSYKVKKSFLVATNDGSGLDKALKIVLKNKKPPYDFYHVLNGVDKIKSGLSISDIHKKYKTPYLLYVARITPWKRQNLAIEIVKLLKEKGIKIKLYMAGQKDISFEYYSQLMDLIKLYGIEDQVEYLGVLDQVEIYSMASNATACLSLYDISNLGNVFLEYLASGGVIISINDNSLDGLIINGENGFLIDNMQEAAEIVERLLNEPVLFEKIKSNAMHTANEKIPSWEERVNFEVGLIEQAFKEYKTK